MATAANKLKCGGMKGKAKGKAKGGLVEDPKKGEKPTLPKGYLPKADGNPLHNAMYYTQNLDNPQAYQNDEIFSSAGQVAGIYNDIRQHGGKDWLKTQGRFMENVNEYSNFFHNMRQADPGLSTTDVDNPGIIGIKDFPSGTNVLGRNTPEGAKYFKSRNRGILKTPIAGSTSGTSPAGRYPIYEPTPMGSRKRYVSKEEYQSHIKPKSEFQYGGEVNPGIYDKMPGTAAEASQALGINTPLGQSSGGGVSGIIGEGIGMVTELGTTAFGEGKKKLALNFDARENPLGDIEKSNKLDTGKAMLKGAGKGAAIGATLGPVGAAIGAVTGTLISGIGRLIGKKNRDAEASEAVKDWSAAWTSKAASHAESSGYKDGGEIKGPGGSKSDSIKMKTEDGSFIVPAENNELGMNIGKTYLGWNDDTVASRNNGGSGIKVSDGELLYTPEEVGILRYHGINLDEFAPNAKTKNKSTMTSGKKNFAKGGWKYDSEKELVIDEANGIAYDKDGNEYTKDTSGELSLSSNNTAVGKSIWSRYGKDGVPELEKPIDQADPDKEAGEFNRKWFDYVPELAGTIQTLGGAAGLMEAGKKPDRMVSATLQKLSTETRRLASYGYEPSVLNALDTQIEKTRRDVSKSITSRGGSPQQVMAQLQSVLSTTIDKKAGVMMANAQEKARKWSDVLRVSSSLAGQEFNINKLKVEDWYKTQDVFAEMLSAGISNIVGARQLKNEQDLMREIGPNNPAFTKTT